MEALILGVVVLVFSCGMIALSWKKSVDIYSQRDEPPFVDNDPRLKDLPPEKP